MTVLSLDKARQTRVDRDLDEFVDKRLKILLSYADENFEASQSLRKLLKYYAKELHPYRSCVKDNMKRFGPGRTENICGTLKDMIRGHHHWIKGRGSITLSDDKNFPEITEGIEQILLSVPDSVIDKIDCELSSHGN